MPLRVSAYYALHYGKEYLAYSIRCVYDHVDRIFLVYSSQPSRGAMNRWPNPDSLKELHDAVGGISDPDGKIEWHCGDYWGQEGYHREFARDLCFEVGKADIALQFDHDEMFFGDDLEEAIALANASEAKYFRLNFVHLWRSFDWACRDEMMPVRLVKKEGKGEEYLRMAHPVYHFGYAQRPELVRYKMPIHGHRAEFRQPPLEWWEGKFMGWKPGNEIGDVHPTCAGIWNPKPFDKGEMPMIMREHPYWDKEIIE